MRLRRTMVGLGQAKIEKVSLTSSIIILLIIGLGLDFSSCEAEHLGKPELQAKLAGKDSSLQSHEEKNVANSACVMMDGLCIAPSDVSSYEAIKAIHARLDDDQSGDIDLTESVDFLREELNYTKGFEKRQKAFHHNDDHHISVHEMWKNWLSNDVHNWTVEQTVSWLHLSVELGQYADVFYENAINGSLLPRLATNHEQFLIRILGIKSATHRSKISIKAIDIILFGAPKEAGSLIKDIFIASLILVIVVMLFKFRLMNRNNNVVVSQMEQDMDVLQKELFGLEKKLLGGASESSPSPQKPDPTQGEEPGEVEVDDEGEHSPPSPSETSSWKDDTSFILHNDLPERYPTEMLDLGRMADLQYWLQLTYEREKLVFEEKVIDVRKQISEAHKTCQRLKPGRKNLFGALSFIHGSIESRGQFIEDAKNSLGNIDRMKNNMEKRWNALEDILEFDIKQNPGLQVLESGLDPKLQTHYPANAEGGKTTVPDSPSNPRSSHNSYRSLRRAN